MFAGGFLFGLFILGAYSTAVFFWRLAALLPALLLITLAGPLGILPIKDVDNITVTLTAVILGYFSFKKCLIMQAQMYGRCFYS